MDVANRCSPLKLTTDLMLLPRRAFVSSWCLESYIFHLLVTHPPIVCQIPFTRLAIHHMLARV